uniref:Guanylate kinase-like domain-containing protein n=1 Tax=Heterorhabditis bacteriophora TaxID=37862 RepID=A0A1I7WN56_HETBA
MDVERMLSTCELIEARRREKLYDVIPATAIQNIIDRNLHCIVDISPAGIQRLHSLRIYPIVIRIKFKSAKQVKDIKEDFTGEKLTTKQAKDMIDKCIFSVVMEQLPIQKWSEYYYSTEEKDNPLNRDGALQFIIIFITLLLMIYLIFLSQGVKEDPTRTFALIQIIPISLNMVPRILKAIVLGSTISTGYKCIYYGPIILFSIIFGIIHFNFNHYLAHISLSIYFLYIVASTLATFAVVALVIPFSVFRKNTEDKQHAELTVISYSNNALMWLYPFICLATVPTLYLTVMSAFDFAYVMLSFEETHSSFYINLSMLRPFILMINPIIVICGILLILPSYRNRLFFYGKWKGCSKISPGLSAVEVNGRESPKPCVQMETLELTSNYRSTIQQVIPGHLENLNQYLYPGATPIDPGKTVIAGGLSRLDPDIYPGASSVVPVALSPIPTSTESSLKKSSKV